MKMLFAHYYYKKTKVSIADKVDDILKPRYDEDKLFEIHETVRIPIFEVIEDEF